MNSNHPCLHLQRECNPLPALRPSAPVSAVSNEWGDHPDEPQDEPDLRASRLGAGVPSHREQVSRLVPVLKGWLGLTRPEQEAKL